MLAWHLLFFLRSNLAILLIQILKRRGIHTYSVLLAAFLDFFLAQNCAVICMHAFLSMDGSLAKALMKNGGRIRRITSFC